MATQPTALDKMLCFDIYAANLAFGRLYKPLLDELGLTYPQFLVLLSLWSEDGRSVGALGTALSLDSSTLTPMLKRLEAQGLVTRRRDARDERRVIVALTPRGRALEQPAQHVLACVGQALSLGQTDADGLHSLLLRLRSNLVAAGPG